MTEPDRDQQAETREQKLIKAYLADRDVACPVCNYNLRGLQTTACPECQFNISVGLIGKRYSKTYLLGLIVLSGSFGTCAFQLASIVILHFLVGPDLLDLDSLLYGRFTFMGLVSGIFLWLWVSFATQMEQSSRRRRLVLALCTLIVPITIIVVAYIRFAWEFLPKLFEFAEP